MYTAILGWALKMKEQIIITARITLPLTISMQQKAIKQFTNLSSIFQSQAEFPESGHLRELKNRIKSQDHKPSKCLQQLTRMSTYENARLQE